MSVINDWATGYCAQVRVRNVGTANITAWSVVYDLGEGVITTAPACKYTHEGTRYTFANINEGDGFLAYPTGNTLFTYCAATPHEVDRPILISIWAEGGILDRSGAGEQNGIRVEPTMPYDWSSGYCVDVVVRNVRSTPVTNWETVINIGQSTVQNLWSASYTSASSSNGMLVTIKPLDNNRALAASAETKIGFCGVTNGKSYSPKFVSATAVP
jgi:cellulase/cellobiase CelA1